MKPLLSSLLLAALLLLFARSARAEETITALVYDGYATPTALRLSGRVLEDYLPPPVDGAADGLTNTVATLDALESDEVEGALVRVEVRGLTFETRSDVEGMWEIRVAGLPDIGSASPLPVHASLPEIEDGIAGQGLLFVHDPRAATCVISDVDDTIVESHISDTLDMIWTALTSNAAQKKVVPGAPEAFARAREAGAGAFFYVSGSPWNFHAALRQYLALRSLPPGPLLLKNLGDDPTFDQQSYKLRRLRELLGFYPGLRCALVGDSGESDAEVYRQIQKEFPDQILGIVIRQVPGSELTQERAAGITTVESFAKTPGVIAGVVAGAPGGSGAQVE